MSHPHAFYVPLAADEQDTIQRMLEQNDLYVEVVGWGYHPNPTITAGDKRVQVRFPMEFVKPQGIEVPVTRFRLRLKMRDGRTVAETVESTVYNNQPLYVTAGMQIDLVWDLSLDRIDDEIKKLILPGIQGKKVAQIENGKVIRKEE